MNGWNLFGLAVAAGLPLTVCVCAVCWPERRRPTAGLPVIRLHDARHAATILLESGAPVPAVTKWLGHDPAVLLRVYGHTFEESLAAAGTALFGDEEEATGSQFVRRIGTLSAQ